MKLTQLVLLIVVFILLVAGITYGFKWFNSATTPVQTFSPKPGITCVSMVLHDAVALSCLKDEK